jgi:DNA-binding MarR family transcriptional regulator
MGNLSLGVHSKLEVILSIFYHKATKPDRFCRDESMMTVSRACEGVSFTGNDLRRLVAVAEELALRHATTPSAAISRIEAIIRPSPSSSASKLSQFVDKVRLIRLRRNQIVGADLFRDPAWEILLALFSAHEEGHQETVTSLCHASGVPFSTALRVLDRLEEHKLLIRRDDRNDRRRRLVNATDLAIGTVRSLAAMLAAEGQQIGGEMGYH